MKDMSRFSVRLTIGIALFLFIFPLFAEGAPADPKQKGTLRIAMAGLAQEGFLPDIGNLEQGRAWAFVYDYPLYINSKTLETMPGLLKRFEYSKDGLTITLNIREGVPWQQGWGEVTAEDFKYTFERIMRETSTSGAKENFSIVIKSMEVKGPHTLLLHLKQPAPEFWVSAFGTMNAMVPIVCKKYIEKVGDDKARFNPVGSGPYRLVEHRPGDYMKFEALEKHWRVVPEFRYVILKIVPEESTRIAMLKAGDVDIAAITSAKIPSLQKEAGIKAEPWPGGYSLLGCFGGMEPPTDERYNKDYHMKDPWVDIRVREAMNLAIDRNAIVKSIYKDAATPMAIAWALPGWDKLSPIPYNPVKAKQLLAEAGYPKGFNVTVAAVHRWAPSHEIAQVMEIVAAYFEAIGLKVTIKSMDYPEIRRLHKAGKTAGMIYPWKETYKTTYSGRHFTKFVPNADPVLFSSDELTALTNKYESEMDFAKRAAALDKIRDYHYKNKVTIPLVMASPVWAWRTDIVGEWPRSPLDKLEFFEYIRHPKPLNTWRLFTP